MSGVSPFGHTEVKTKPLVDNVANWHLEVAEGEGIKQFNSLDQWVHHYQHIMQNGMLLYQHQLLPVLFSNTTPYHTIPYHTIPYHTMDTSIL